VILCLAVTALVAIGSWCAVLCLRLRSTSLLVLAWTVVLAAHLVGLVLLCGVVLRSLQPWALTVTAIAVAGAEIAVALRRRALVRGSLEVLRGRARRWWRSPLVLAMGALALVQYAWQAAIAVRLPQVSYDTLSYHLIAPATWIQHGAIVHTGQSLFADVYPQDQEAASAWAGTFLHSLRYAGLTPLLFVAMGAAAVVVLARHLGIRPRYAALAGLAYICVPAVAVQAATGYNDVAAASPVLALLAFLVEVPIGARVVDGALQGVIGPLLLVGLAGGLAVGTKSSNLVVAVLAGIGVVVQLVRVHDRFHPHAALPSARRLLAVCGGPVVALGAYWYVRTYVEYSNPFYPVTMLGFRGWGPVDQVIIGANKPVVLDGLPFGAVGEVVRSWIEDRRHHPIGYDQRLGGLGLQWLVLGAPALAVAAVGLVRRKRWAFLSLVVVPIGASAIASPAPWWARYTLAVAALGGVAVAWGIELLARQPRRSLHLAGWAMGTALVALTGLSTWWAADPTYFSTVAADGTAQPLALHDAISLVRDPSTADRLYPWSAYRSLDDLPDGSVIALTPSGEEPFTYPWVGPNLERRLVLLPVVATPDALAGAMHDAGARYVALRTSGRDGALGQAVAQDRSRFLARTQGGPLNGADLYEVGRWRDCGQPDLVIRRSTYDSSRNEITVGGTLSDRCGALAGATLERWSNDATGAPWQGADRLRGQVRTGPQGIFVLTFAGDQPQTRYFLRFPGRRDRAGSKPSAATRLFTALEAANGVAGGAPAP
jgi:hypothetical protein